MSVVFRLSRSTIVKIGLAGLATQTTIVKRNLSCDAVVLPPTLAPPRQTAGTAAPVVGSSKADRRLVAQVQRAGSFLWKMLKSVYRALQLMILYSPAVGSSPLLLFPSADIHLLWWSILKGSIKRSGPCFTKLAQWIATRPDLFPGYICRELETLQVSAVTHSWAETERALLAALGPELYEKITIVDKTKYTGSGSAAQVYLGLYNHEKIAIKVLHPGIRDAMNADLDILSLITSVAELFPGVSSMSLHEGMEEFRNLLLQQLNLKSEAEALLRFRENFKGPKWEDEVRFPKPLMELTSSEVLFESFEDGCSISRYLDSDKKTKSKLANLCLDVLLKMVGFIGPPLLFVSRS